MVVNAAGMWGMEIGRMAGVRIPAVAVEHQYVLTGPIPDVTPAELRDMPTMRDPDLLVYYKPDGPGLLIGGYEPDTLPFGLDGVPVPFQRQLLEPNFDRFEQLATLAAQRTPVVEQAGIRTMINGPIPYSADADFVMGKVPELDNYYVATGFLYGIAAGGGAGKMMAEWILEGRPSLDLWPLDVRRFAFHHTTHHFMGSRMVELYAHHYKLAAPGSEHVTSRGVQAQSAARRAGRRRARCTVRVADGSDRRGSPRRASRRSIGLRSPSRTGSSTSADEAPCGARASRPDRPDRRSPSSRSPDRGALDAVQWLSVADMDKPVGTVTYTQLCNERGGIECDLTMTRLGEQHWYVVTGSAFGAHDMGWIRSNSPDDDTVQIRDLTSANAVINLCGPMAREVLQAVCEDDVSNEAFRYATAREITIGAAPVLAMRIGYVGELGWELHVPTEYTAHVYELLAATRAGDTASPTSATGRSTRCGWRRGTCTGRPTSPPTRRRGRPASAGGSSLRQGRLLRTRRAGGSARRRRDSQAVHVHARADGLPGQR